jgi:hypothetical protein
MHKFFCEAYPLKSDRPKVPPRGRANRQPGFGPDGPAKAAAPGRHRFMMTSLARSRCSESRVADLRVVEAQRAGKRRSQVVGASADRRRRGIRPGD